MATILDNALGAAPPKVAAGIAGAAAAPGFVAGALSTVGATGAASSVAGAVGTVVSAVTTVAPATGAFLANFAGAGLIVGAAAPVAAPVILVGWLIRKHYKEKKEEE